MIDVHRLDLAPRACLGGAAVKMRPDKQLPPPEAFSKALAGYQPVSPRHAAILKSWREHSSKNKLWQALECAAAKHGVSPPQPVDFIEFVLGCTRPAKRLNDHRETVLGRFEKLKREIAKVVEDAIYPRDLWRDLVRFESVLRELDRSDYDIHAVPAKDQNRSRDRKMFAQSLFPYLKDCCGEYLAEDVTEMINIIYPILISTDYRVVKKWLAEISPKPPV